MKQLIAVDLTSVESGRMFPSYSYPVLVGSDKWFPFQKYNSQEKLVFQCL